MFPVVNKRETGVNPRRIMDMRGIITVCELVEKYLMTKTGVNHSTRTGYKFVQNILAKEPFGQRKIATIKTSDAKIFLIKMQEDGRGYIQDFFSWTRMGEREWHYIGRSTSSSL